MHEARKYMKIRNMLHANRNKSDNENLPKTVHNTENNKQHYLSLSWVIITQSTEFISF
jgi:hypothetical protein